MNAKKPTLTKELSRDGVKRRKMNREIDAMNKRHIPPEKCPNCGNDSLDYDIMDYDSGIPFQRVHCEDCGLSWIEEYTYNGMFNLKFDEEVPYL